MPFEDKIIRKVKLVRRGEVAENKTIKIQVDANIIEQFTVPAGKKLIVRMVIVGTLEDN